MECVGIAALRAAKDILGTETAVANVVGRTQPYIHDVLTEGTRVPAEWCIPLERATAAKGKIIHRSQFRPDIYPDDDSAVRAKRQRESAQPIHQSKRAGATG